MCTKHVIQNYIETKLVSEAKIANYCHKVPITFCENKGWQHDVNQNTYTPLLLGNDCGSLRPKDSSAIVNEKNEEM